MSGDGLSKDGMPVPTANGHVWPSDGLADSVLDKLLRVPAVHPAAMRHGRDEEMPELRL